MDWIEDKQIITEKIFELININNIELFGIIRENFNEVETIFPLIKFIISRLEAVTSLTMNDQLWDAEIILRSVLETFIKFIFITSASKEEQEKRINEYWHLLSETNSMRESAQAKKNLELWNDSETHRIAFTPIILSEDEENRLRAKWSKSERKKLEQKWSFSEMINSITKDYHGAPCEIMAALSHSYRIGSHIMHGDEIGISIIEERESRLPSEIQDAKAGHFLRLMNDCLTYSTSTSIETMLFLNLPEKASQFSDFASKISEIDHIVNKYKGKVFEDEIYNKYRKSSTE